MHNSCLCVIQFTCDVFKGVSMSLRLKFDVTATSLGRIFLEKLNVCYY